MGTVLTNRTAVSRLKQGKSLAWLSIIGLAISCGIFFAVEAQAQAPSEPTISLGVNGPNGPESWTIGIRILFLLTALTLAPAFVMMMTSFTRIVIVLALLRQAMGTIHSPPNQVVVGLALFLTLFIMMPVWDQVRSKALDPYMKDEISQSVALEQAIKPMQHFMLKQVREKDLSLFLSLSGIEDVKNSDQLPLRVLIPAFVTSELRTAFQIGFIVYIPFLVIDMVVASILMSMGMMLLPPVMISLPFKLILFVLADGWFLVVGSLMKSFQ